MVQYSPVVRRLLVIAAAGLALGACHRHRRDAAPVETVLPITSETPAEPKPAREPPPPPQAEAPAAETVTPPSPPTTAATAQNAAAAPTPPAPAKIGPPPTDGAFGPDYSAPSAPNSGGRPQH